MVWLFRGASATKNILISSKIAVRISICQCVPQCLSYGLTPSYELNSSGLVNRMPHTCVVAVGKKLLNGSFKPLLRWPTPELKCPPIVNRYSIFVCSTFILIRIEKNRAHYFPQIPNKNIQLPITNNSNWQLMFGDDYSIRWFKIFSSFPLKRERRATHPRPPTPVTLAQASTI